MEPPLVRPTMRTTIQTLSIALLVLASCLAVAARTDWLGGIQVYAVKTGSMEPTLPVGSLLLVRTPAANRPLGTGDILTFAEPGSPQVMVTHRITGSDGSGNFRTKGDANPAEDPWLVNRADIRGVLLAHYDHLGTVVTALNSRAGIFWLVLVPVLALAFLDIHTIVETSAELHASRRQRTPDAR